MSDQEAQLNDTQNNIRPFLLSAIAKANTTLADSNARMIAISNMITAQEKELRTCYNDGLGQRNNDFAEDSSPTNQTVQVHDYLLQKRNITDVTDPNKQEPSKPCLAASASSSVNDESFNTVKDGASTVKVEPHETMALDTVPHDAVGMAALSAAADAQGDTSSAAGSINSFGTSNVSNIDTYPPPLGDGSSGGGHCV
jgi:hypothetical protein